MAGKGGPYKVFVGGLPQEATTETLEEYFGTFGTLTDVVVMSDRATGRSRGFGFVSFDVPDAVEQIMAMHKDHQILGKWIDCKNATPEGTKGGFGMGGMDGGMGKGGYGGGYGGGGMKGGKGKPSGGKNYGASSYGGYAAFPPPSSCGGGCGSFDGSYGGYGPSWSKGGDGYGANGGKAGGKSSMLYLPY
eukprot:symbB.v1.2.032288.t1/scaffold3855.1/size87046/5